MRREGGRGESPLRGCYARKSVGDETCPCGGGRTWEERSLLAVRLVPCGGGRTWEERSLLAGRPVHAGEGTPSVLRTSPLAKHPAGKYDNDNLGCEVRGWIVGFGGDLAMRPIHAGERDKKG